ncbi:MAG: acyl-CoA reductase [Candidatus Thorarchaeota archaeon]
MRCRIREIDWKLIVIEGETTITESQREEIHRGYYLPEELDKEIQKRIEEINGVKVELLNLDRANIEKIIRTLKKNQMYLETRCLDDIVDSIASVLNDWSIDSTYERKERVMEVLPKLTGHSKEQLEFYSLGTFESMDLLKVKELIKKIESNTIGKEIFKEFVSLGDVKLRGYASPAIKIKLGVSTLFGPASDERQPILITNVTPSNVTGLLEVGSVLYSALSKAATIVKTPSKQPIFGPAFLESLEEKDLELASTIAILNWQGGDHNIEDIIYRNSDIVNVVGDNETISAVKTRVEDIKETRGTYHGAKIGLEIIGSEYPNSQFSIEELATLVIIDIAGHEGYACHSPAFGVFIEGSKDRAKVFSEELKNQAEIIDNKIPQGRYFQSLREQFLLPMLVDSKISDKEIYKSGYTIIEYSPQLEFNPMCRNRTIRIMPISNISEVISGLNNFQRRYGENMLQTTGIAVSNSRLEEISDKLGRIGVTNIRALGGVNFPKAGETWDGKIPIREFKVDDPVRYTSIPSDINNELSVNLNRVTKYVN